MKFIKITFITLLSVMLFACSKKDSSPLHIIAVPQDAIFVMQSNNKAIVDKAGLNNYQQYKFGEMLDKEIEKMPAKQAKLIKDFMKDTRSSGLNLDETTFFITKEDRGKEPIEVGFTCKMNDRKLYEKNIKEELNSGIEIQENGEYSTAQVDGDVYIMWNDNVLLITNYKTESINADAAKSILANEKFKNVYEQNKDFCMYLNVGYLFEIVEKYDNDKNRPAKIYDLFKDSECTATIDAQKGKIIVNNKIYPEAKAKEIFAKFYRTNFNENIYKYFPKNNIMVGKAAINPTGAYEWYKDILDVENYNDSTATAMDDDYAYSKYYELEKIRKSIKENDAEIKEVLSYFDGDIMLSLNGFAKGMMPIPEFCAAIGVNPEKTSEITAYLTKNGLTANDKGYYTFPIPSEIPMTVYCAIKDNIAYICGSEAGINSFLDKGYSSDITSNKDIGSDIKSASYFYWNLNINDYPAIAKMGMNMSEQGRIISSLWEKLGSLSAKQISESESNFTLKLNDDSDYPTKVILKVVDEIVAQQFN